MKPFLTTLLFIITVGIVFGQQSPQENQFYSPFRFPTAVHSSEGSSVSTVNLVQKIGGEAIFLSFNLLGTVQIKNHGINLHTTSSTSPFENYFQYRIGYSYKFNLKKDIHLFIGTNLGISQMYHRKRYYHFTSEQEPILAPQSGTSTFDFDFGLGVGIQIKKFRLEFSANDILSLDVHPQYSKTTKINLKSTYDFKFGNFNFNPGIYSRVETANNSTAPGYIELQLELGYKNRFFITPVYRTLKQFGLRTHHHFGGFSFFYGFIFAHHISKYNFYYNEFGLKYRFNN